MTSRSHDMLSRTSFGADKSHHMEALPEAVIHKSYLTEELFEAAPGCPP